MSTHAEIVAALQSRWPENRVAPSLSRIRALTGLLGDPQRSVPVIQLTGTNGKGSTAIIIESLLRSVGLRVGRFSSPHLEDLTERIAIDGEPISPERFDALVGDVLPLVELVDAQELDGVPMTFFEVMTGLAYEAFAQAPVDVAVVEVGLGGTWDATSVAEAQVAVITPVDLDHTHLLGESAADIAREKVGIIKAGSVTVSAAQYAEVMDLIAERTRDVGVRLMIQGRDFSVLERTPAVGGQVLRLDTASGPVGDLYLPLFGAHMAENAALAVAAVEAFLGGRGLAPDVISDGLATVHAPARLEVARISPSVVLDTAHNPHGVAATLAGVREAFDFEPLIAVVGVMADKDVEGMLAILEEQAAAIICTQVTSTARGMTAEDLAEIALDRFDPDQVYVRPSLVEAIDTAAGLADETGGGVLVVGSAILAGEARALLVRRSESDDDA